MLVHVVLVAYRFALDHSACLPCLPGKDQLSERILLAFDAFLICVVAILRPPCKWLI